MELKTEKLSVKLDGVVHELNYPSVKQIKGLEKDEKDVKIDDIITLLTGCGLPLDICESLQANHLNALVGALMGKQKS